MNQRKRTSERQNLIKGKKKCGQGSIVVDWKDSLVFEEEWEFKQRKYGIRGRLSFDGSVQV